MFSLQDWPFYREGVGAVDQILACLHNPRLVPKLLAGGCSPNSTPAGRETPLMALIGKPWPGDAQKALLDEGADPNAAVHNGNTALSWAIRLQANPLAIWQLLQAGASTSPVLLDEPGEDCLTLAFERHGAALELLLKPVWGADTALLKAFLADPKKCARINPDAQPVVAKFLAEEARIALDAALPPGHGADLGVASRPRL